MFSFIKDNAVKLAVGTGLVIAGAATLYWTIRQNEDQEATEAPAPEPKDD